MVEEYKSQLFRLAAVLYFRRAGFALPHDITIRIFNP